MVYTSHSSMQHGRPLHLEIVHRLQREIGAAGATVLRGIWGYHGDHPPHGDRIFQIRRHVPVCTIVIDRPERIAHSFRIIDEITAEHGLVTSEMVPAAQAMSVSETRGGLRLARHRF
jgi:PII-like signaling protein